MIKQANARNIVFHQLHTLSQPTSDSENFYTLGGFRENCREDGRGCLEYREKYLQFESIKGSDASCQLSSHGGNQILVNIHWKLGDETDEDHAVRTARLKAAQAQAGSAFDLVEYFGQEELPAPKFEVNVVIRDMALKTESRSMKQYLNEQLTTFLNSYVAESFDGEGLEIPMETEFFKVYMSDQRWVNLRRKLVIVYCEISVERFRGNLLEDLSIALHGAFSRFKSPKVKILPNFGLESFAAQDIFCSSFFRFNKLCDVHVDNTDDSTELRPNQLPLLITISVDENNYLVDLNLTEEKVLFPRHRAFGDKRRGRSVLCAVVRDPETKKADILSMYQWGPSLDSALCFEIHKLARIIGEQIYESLDTHKPGQPMRLVLPRSQMSE